MPFPSWTTIATLAALLSGIGFAIDKWLLKRHKKKLHSRLTDWWVHLDDTKLPDLPAWMASATLRSVRPVLRSKARFIAATSTISVLLTLNALVLGPVIAGYASSYLDELRKGTWLFDVEVLRMFLPINLLCDTLTLLVTIKVLRVVARGRPIHSGAAIILDLFLAVGFAWACGAISAAFLEYSGMYYDVFLKDGWFLAPLNVLVAGTFEMMNHTAQTVDLLLSGSASDDAVAFVLFSTTTLLPTLAYLFVLLIMLLGKLLLGIFKRTLAYALERAADDEPEKLQVVCLTATLLSLLAIFAKTIAHFVGAGSH